MLRVIVLKGMRMTFQKRKKQLQTNISIVIGKPSFNLKKSSENKILHAPFLVNSCLYQKIRHEQLIAQIRKNRTRWLSEIILSFESLFWTMVWKIKKDSAWKAEQLNYLKFIDNIYYPQNLTKLSKESQQWTQLNEQKFFTVLKKKRIRTKNITLKKAPIFSLNSYKREHELWHWCIQKTTTIEDLGY